MKLTLEQQRQMATQVDREKSVEAARRSKAEIEAALGYRPKPLDPMADEWKGE